MAKIEILVGTTLGSAEYVADEMAAQLTRHDHDAVIHLNPALSELHKTALWLVVTSTHGAGDLPDNIQPFFNEIVTAKPDLSSNQFAICAIGDSSYDTFCQGAEKLAQVLEECGAKTFVDKIRIDVQQDPLPEEPALAWLNSWLDRL